MKNQQKLVKPLKLNEPTDNPFYIHDCINLLCCALCRYAQQIEMENMSAVWLNVYSFVLELNAQHHPPVSLLHLVFKFDIFDQLYVRTIVS